MDYRSPLENIISIFGTLPQGHDKPVKHAVYNALAIFLLVLGCAAGWALYLILEPFIKPLMWAVLVGSVLHPLKHKLAQQFRSWFDHLDESHTPIVLGLLLVPVNIVNNLSELLGNRLMQHLKIILATLVILPLLHVVYFYTPKFLIRVVFDAGSYSSYLISFVIDHSTVSLIAILLIGYISSIIFIWTPKNNVKFHCASVLIWLLLSCCVANQCGSLKIPIFVLLQLVFFGGFVLEIREIQQQLILSGEQLSLVDYFKTGLVEKPTKVDLTEEEHKNEIHDKLTLTDKEIKELKNTQNSSQPRKLAANDGDCSSESLETISDSKSKDPWSLELFQDNLNNEVKEKRTGILITEKGNIHVIKQSPDDLLGNRLIAPKVKRSLSQPYVSSTHMHRPKYSVLNWKRTNSLLNLNKLEQSSSDFYLYSVMWACITILFWKNVMLLPILPIPIIIYIIKHVGIYLGIWKWLLNYWNKIIEVVKVWCNERYDALVPIHIRGLCKLTCNINSSLKKIVKDSIDTVSSCVVIFGLIIFVLCASIFIAIQVYAEGIMLVQMSSNVINQTVVHNPELRQLLPPTFDDTVDSLLDNAYLYGREGISKVVKSIMSDVDPAKSEKFERQVLELWDRVYQTWMSSDGDHGPKVTSDAVQHSWDNFVEDIQKSPELFNVTGIMAFLKQNVGTLLSLLESIWNIVKGNIGLLVGSFSAFMSVLLGGGTAVLNFMLNLIIFLTTLFYLLTSSGYLYKPVEIMSNFSSSSSRFGLAFGVAINGVFTASFKMVAFYGMWTWFIHNLFGVKIVYIPTVLAAVLAAAPFLGTYWACIPAVLDLWLAQGKTLYAILMAIFQFLPTSVVDTTIYGEIKGGGHPYLTGLAIAGGIFCLGLEGAIIGPLILCGLYVAIDLSSTLFKDSPSEETINLQHLSSR